MSTAIETKTEVEEISALRGELKVANERIEELEKANQLLDDEVDDLKDELESMTPGGPAELEEKIKLFADPANWTQNLSNDKFVWSPYMAVTEQDPITLANQIVDLLQD